MKRSSQIGLFLAGTAAVGGTAWLAMPSENCDPARPGYTVSGQPASTVACSRRPTSSSSGGGGGSSSRSSYSLFSGGSSDSGSTTTSRGGFGSFGHMFSGGG